MKRLFLWLLLGQFLWACGSGGGGEAGSSLESETDSTEQVEDTPKPQVEIDRVATNRSRIMAGVELDDKTGYDSVLGLPETQKHYEEFNRAWAKLELERLSKIRDWRKTELAEFNETEHNLFYPFSGPDFLNAFEFFPNCDNYILFGLEPNGKLVDIQNMPPGYLGGIRTALEEIFVRNYFITSFMSRDLWGKGVLPIINIFMARTDNQIVDIKGFYLDEEGKPNLFEIDDEDTGAGKLTGIMIEFLNTGKSKSQKVYYFGTDVEDSKMAQKPELVTFIKSFSNKITLIKSASYILFNENFKTIKGLVLDETSAVLQDDTGVPYRDYVEKGWEVNFYGKYARPVADFQSYTYQPKLRDAFVEFSDRVKPLPFTYGYHWKTDNSSVLLCRKPKK